MQIQFYLKILIYVVSFILTVIFFGMIFFFSLGISNPKIENIKTKSSNNISVISKLDFVDIGRHSNKLFLKPNDTKLSYFDDPFLITSDMNPKVDWISLNTLQIEINNADINKYQNYVYLDGEKYNILLKFKGMENE